MKKFNQCKTDGTAKQYTGCLWKCQKPQCEHIMDYGGMKLCKIPIKEEIISKRKSEAKQ